jgi:hypothetical protein
MAKTYKTTNNLNKVWGKLDKAYENLESAFVLIEGMADIPKDLKQAMDQIDLSAISGAKQEIEILLEEKKNF